jgi:hypothetical protein
MKLSSRLFSLISKKKALKATLAITRFLLTTATLSIASTVLTANKASAELITVRDYNFSLNTNANYRLIDGSPRLSMYQSNPKDGDQNFYAYDVPGGRNIKHLGLNKCLNAHYKYSGAEINTWACNQNDPDQLWENVAKGTDYVLIRLKNTNLCLTANNPPSNGSLVTLQTCYYNIPTNSQDWQGSLHPNSPFYSGGSIPSGQLPQPNFSGNLIRTGGSGTVSNNFATVQNFRGEYRDLKAGLPPTVASPDPMWIYGGIQEAEFCNGNFGIKHAVVAKIVTSPNVYVSRVENKLFSRIEVLLAPTWIVIDSGVANWQNVWWGNRQQSGNTFTHTAIIPYTVQTLGPLPVRMSTHIYLRNSTTGVELPVVYDLGGIIDFGTISSSECLKYNRTF